MRNMYDTSKNSQVELVSLRQSYTTFIIVHLRVITRRGLRERKFFLSFSLSESRPSTFLRVPLDVYPLNKGGWKGFKL